MNNQTKYIFAVGIVLLGISLFVLMQPIPKIPDIPNLKPKKILVEEQYYLEDDLNEGDGYFIDRFYRTPNRIDIVVDNRPQKIGGLRQIKRIQRDIQEARRRKERSQKQTVTTPKVVPPKVVPPKVVPPKVVPPKVVPPKVVPPKVVPPKVVPPKVVPPKVAPSRKPITQKIPPPPEKLFKKSKNLPTVYPSKKMNKKIKDFKASKY